MSSEPPLPSLALGDIIHLAPPSPAHADLAGTENNPGALSESPEPVTDAERARFVKRLSDLGLSAKDNPDINPRERELVDMILRLTNDTPPDRSQLVYQADVIASLASQRDFLVMQAEEQRSRWASETDGWARIAEALISQRIKFGSSDAKVDDIERQCASFESDNKALREKLSEAHSRLSTLESELARLRPLLLMQPVPAPSNTLSTAATPSRQRVVNSRKKKDKARSSPLPDGQHVIDVGPDLAVDEIATHTTPSNYYNNPGHTDQTRADDLQRKRTPKRHKVPKSSTIPLTSDARAEHLLLAARKIGRQRVEMLARLKAIEVKESEDERRDSSPKTPKRPPQQAHLTPHTFASAQDQIHTPHGLNPAFVFLNNPMGLSPSFTGSPLHPQFLVPIHGYPSMQTPTQRRVFDKNSVPGTATSPQTPLDSLLSAARSMLDSGSTTQANGVSSVTANSNGKTRRANVVDMPESPVPPKRRKIVGGSTSGSAGLVRRVQSQAQVDTETGVAEGVEVRRVKSALDVLADQAAVFSSNERGGKGKERRRDVRQKGTEPGEVSPVNKAKPKKIVKKEKTGKDKDKDSEVIMSELDAEQGGESRIASNRATEDQTHWDVSGMWTVLKPPGSPVRQRSPEDDNDVDKGWMAGPSLRPVTLWERGDMSQPETVRRHELDVEIRSNIQNQEEGEGGDDDQQDMFSPTQESLQSLNTPSRPRAQTPLRSTDQDPSDDEDGELRSSPPKRVLPTAITLERSLSEGGREQSQSNVEPRRAVSIPPDATPSGVDQNDLSEGGAQQRREPTIQPESSLDSVATLDSADSRHEDLTLGNVEPDEETGQDDESGDVDRDSVKIGRQELQVVMSGKRPRSPYVKWSKEEDDLLAQAVAKYGQKWDQVQKALPTRGYHQVRQRWLRKLGVFDSKPDLSTFQTSPLRVPTGSVGTDRPVDPPPKLKLGLAPLSSELVYSALGRGTSSDDNQNLLK